MVFERTNFFLDRVLILSKFSSDKPIQILEDIIIIGAGSAGLGAIGMAKDLNWNPLVIEMSESNVGGDCLNFGCVPSKAIIHLAKQFNAARHTNQFGLQITGKADLSKIMDYVHQKQSIIRAHESADYLRSNGVNLKIGQAKFLNKNTIEVNGNKTYQSKRIIVATGSKPRMIPFPGLDQVDYYTNETIFYDLKVLPKRFLVIGGGPIGCELGQVFQRFGSQVTILNRSKQILGKERPEISQVVHDAVESEGVTIINNASLEKFVSPTKAVYKIDDEEYNLEFDSCLLSIGRTLNSDNLNLSAAGIETDSRGRPVLNDLLESTNSNVFFAGDAAGMYQFSHGAEKHIKLLKHNFTNHKKIKHSTKDLSWVTFTDPEIATFGYSEEELNKLNIPYWRQDQGFGDDDRAIVGEYTSSRCTLFFSEAKGLFHKSRKILGGTMVAPNAGEIIQELILASNTEMDIKHLFDKLYPYPTASRINQQVILGVVNNDKKN